MVVRAVKGLDRVAGRIQVGRGDVPVTIDLRVLLVAEPEDFLRRGSAATRARTGLRGRRIVWSRNPQLFRRRSRVLGFLQKASSLLSFSCGNWCTASAPRNGGMLAACVHLGLFWRAEQLLAYDVPLDLRGSSIDARGPRGQGHGVPRLLRSRGAGWCLSFFELAPPGWGGGLPDVEGPTISNATEGTAAGELLGHAAGAALGRWRPMPR